MTDIIATFLKHSKMVTDVSDEIYAKNGLSSLGAILRQIHDICWHFDQQEKLTIMFDENRDGTASLLIEFGWPRQKDNSICLLWETRNMKDERRTGLFDIEARSEIVSLGYHEAMLPETMLEAVFAQAGEKVARYLTDMPELSALQKPDLA